LKAFQGQASGDSGTDAVAYATAITGWLVELKSRAALSVDQWRYVQEATAGEQIMLGACAMGAGALAAEGLVNRHAHAVCKMHEVLGVKMLRLEATESKCAPLLFLEVEKAAKKKSTIEGESLRYQLEGALEVFAKEHTTPDAQTSFWISGPDFDAAFDTLIAMHDVSAHEHHQSHEYLWEELEQPLAVPPCMLLHSNTEAPTELLVSVSSALSAWSPPELEETEAPEDGDAPAPEPPVAPPIPEVSIMVEEWDWALGHVKRAARGTTTHNVSLSIKVPAGPHVYRLNITAPVGYHAFVSSATPFSLGDYEAVLKEQVALPSVTCLEAPTAAVPASRTSVVFRTNVKVTEDCRVAAYLQVCNAALQKSYRLRFIDNAKGTSVQYMSLHMPAHKVPATEQGYTLVLECTSDIGAPCPSSSARVVVISDKEGVTTELAMFESLRESAGEQELNLSKDTVLLKYLLEPSTAEEVASFQLIVNDCDRGVCMELLDKDQKQLQMCKGQHQCMLVYCPLSFVDPADNYTLLCTILAPDADMMIAEAEKAKERAKEAEEGSPELGAAMKCLYSFTIHSVSGFAVSVDTRRQDRAVELKGEWEASEKGRAERAKAARDKYLAPPVAEEEQSLGPKDPTKAQRPSLKNVGSEQATARIISPEERQERQEGCTKELEEYKASHESVVSERGLNADRWRESTSMRTEGLTTEQGSKTKFWATQNSRLDSYKASLPVPES